MDKLSTGEDVTGGYSECSKIINNKEDNMTVYTPQSLDNPPTGDIPPACDEGAVMAKAFKISNRIRASGSLYKAITARTLEGLESAVSEMIGKGYIPTGGIVDIGGNDGYIFVQSVYLPVSR